MKSKQINFYFRQDDISEINKYIQEKDLSIYNHYSINSNLQKLDSLLQTKIIEKKERAKSILDAYLKVRPDMLEF